MTITRGTRALLLQEPAEEPPARPCPGGLDQDVQDVAVLVDGPPQVLPIAVDLDEDLVQVPLVAGPGLAAAQAGRVGGPELGAPLPDRLVGDDHAALEHELLDLAEAQREAVVQPHAVGDDLDRVPVTLVRHLAHDGPSGCVSTPRSSASAAPLTNLTVPQFEVRRFRPNIVVRPENDDAGFVESTWVGRELRIGDDVVLAITDHCPRCVMTTLPQGGLAKDSGILRTAARHNEVHVGVYAEVRRAGRVQRGDTVTLG